MERIWDPDPVLYTDYRLERGQNCTAHPTGSETGKTVLARAEVTACVQASRNQTPPNAQGGYGTQDRPVNGPSCACHMTNALAVASDQFVMVPHRAVAKCLEISGLTYLTFVH